MKTQTQKTLTIDAISDSIQAIGLAQTKTIFGPGAKVSLSGRIAKIVKGEGKIKLFLQGGQMKVFAEFPKADFLLMVGKGKTIELSGTLQTFGFDALCLSNCRITGIV